MKIVLIRHGKVDMKWERSYSSAGFDAANEEYDNSPILEYEGRPVKAEGFDIYISELSRTRATADQMLGTGDYIVTGLLNEVPKRSYRETTGKRPRFWWVMMSRIQWYFNSARQFETRRETRSRAEELITLLEEQGRDAVLVTHEFFLYTFTGILQKHGFTMERSSVFRIKNWERILATKRDLHCGCCQNNCLLSHPGCEVGRAEAIRRGFKPYELHGKDSDS